MQANDFFYQPVFKRVATILWQRYYVNEQFGQTLGKKQLEQVDQEPLYRMLGLTLVEWQAKKSLNIHAFANALEASSFQMNLNEFVELMAKPLVTRTTVVAQEQEAYNHFLNALNQISPQFVKFLSERQLKEWFKQKNLAPFRMVQAGLEQLPQTYTRMPVYAYNVTKNPHAFDERQPAGRLLLQMLTGIRGLQFSELTTIEEKNQLLNHFYLLKDDSKNAVSIRGLQATIGGRSHRLWQAACDEHCSWNVPLKEILKVDIIKPAKGKQVLVVENSGVYSILLEQLPDLAIVCSSGQFTYAVIVLLRKLVESQTTLLYVGDMDPEGLVMAQKMLDLAPQYSQIVGMNEKNYHQFGTESGADLSIRLKQLRQLKDDKLKRIAQDMIETRKIASQEGFIPELIEEVQLFFETTK